MAMVSADVEPHAMAERYSRGLSIADDAAG
jgi:hypothetical protein